MKSKLKHLLLAAALFVSGCVNVHVHFPEAPADKPAVDNKAP
jgi:hypothetical protein